jgi:hypothetical protein
LTVLVDACGADGGEGAVCPPALPRPYLKQEEGAGV